MGSANIARIAVIVARLGPYHVARLKSVGTRLGAQQTIALEVAAEDAQYAWERVETDGFRRVTLVNSRYEHTAALARSRTLIDALEREQPDAVAVNGWGFAEAYAAALWCRKRGRVAILMSDSQERDFVRTPLKEAVKRRFVALCDSALVAGSSHRRYVEALGMDSRWIRVGYDVVDNEHFALGAARSRRSDAATRRELGLPAQYFLSTARFVEKKNLSGLLHAYAAYRRQVAEPWGLVLLGDGPLRGSLEELRHRLGLDDLVQMPGFKQYDELPAYYGLASAFILPSTVEQWGLVVNEAMASGTLVLVSSACGCAEDLVVPDKTGFTFAPSDTAELASKMLSISSQPELRERLARGAQEHIASWGPERFAQALMEAFELGCMRRDLRRPGLLGFMTAP